MQQQRTQRTRTAASLLMGVAALTACGCVAVEPPPPLPVGAGGAHGAHGAARPVVQPRAKEGLETTAATPPAPAPRSRPSSDRVRDAEPPAAKGPAPGSRRDDGPYERVGARPERGGGKADGKAGGKSPGSHARERGHKSDRADPPAPTTRSLGSGSAGSAGICALGESYGGWAHGSPQARICRDAYGG
ncbi:hypothetical protein [Streptomyces sp. NPDC050504]|uniref:hypothetical protein n=1 Tax=Streptomyces sp. NPDC050504 TaxID=3365618 RepID=UPI0037A9C3EF